MYSMENLFSILKLHALAILAFATAFFFWKDYLKHPHHKVDKNKLAHFSGTLSSAGDLLSLPSGYSSGHYIILKEAQTSFIPSGLDFGDFLNEVPEGAQITMAYNPEENPKITGEGIAVFSLKYQNKEYITADTVQWYNDAIDKRRNTAIYTTLAGFLAIGLVEFIRRKFLK